MPDSDVHPTIKCSVYIATSLDGFIARLDGDINWLLNPAYDLKDKNDFGYAAFMATVDSLVMGRHSFEKVLTFNPWPYEKPVVVLSSGDVAVPPALADKVRVRQGEPNEVVLRLAAEGMKHLYIDGGVTIQRFLRAKLIDEITITQIPILLGSGIPLFGQLGIELPLRHLRTEAFANGFVQSVYRVVYT